MRIISYLVSQWRVWFGGAEEPPFPCNQYKNPDSLTIHQSGLVALGLVASFLTGLIAVETMLSFIPDARLPPLRALPDRDRNGRLLHFVSYERERQRIR